MVTRRYLLKNRKRSLVSLIGIVLMTLLMTCVFVGKDTLITHLTRSGESEYGKWDLVGYDLSEQGYRKLLETISSQEIALSTDNYYSDFTETGNPNRPFISVRRYSQSAFDWHRIRLVTGHLPEKEGEVVLSQAVLDEGSKVAIGDELSVSTYRRYLDNKGSTELVFPFINLTLPAMTKTELPRHFAYFGNDSSFPKEYSEVHEETGFESRYRVVGFIEPPSEEIGAAYTALAFLGEGSFPTKDVEVNVSFNLEDTSQVASLRERLGELGVKTVETNNNVLALKGASTDTTINGIVIFAQLFFTLLISGVSIVLIYNLFNLSYDERLRYLSLLTSVGATRKQRRASVYYEAFLLVLLALPLGIILGLGVIYFALKVISPSLLSLFAVKKGVTLLLVVTWQSLIWIIVATAITVFVAAYLPARKMAKQVPLEGLRSTFSPKKSRKKKQVRRLSGAETLLARGFLRYQNHQGKSIVRALAAFVAILLITGYGAQAMLSAVDYKLVQSSTFDFPNRGDWDYHLMGHGDGVALSNQIAKELVQTEGVSNVDVVNYSMFSGQLQAEDMSDDYHRAVYNVLREFYDENWTYDDYWKQYPDKARQYFLSLVSFDDKVFEEMVKAVGGKWDKSENYPIILYQNGEISTTNNNVWQKEARHYRFFEIEQMVKKTLGQELTASFLMDVIEEKGIRGEFQLTVVGLGNKDSLSSWISVHDSQPWVIMPQSAFEKLYQATNNHLYYEQSISFNADKTNRVAKSRVKQLKMLTVEGIQFLEGDLVAVKNYVSNLTTVIRIVMISFVLLTSLICLLNVYNAVAGLMVTRRQNFVILRSLGMTSQQLATMIRREFYVLFAKSLLVGLPLSGLACWLINWGVVQRFGYFKVILPVYFWLSILICYALVLLLVQLLIVRENKRSLIDDIRRETV